MPNPWNDKKGNRGSLVIGPLVKGERHEISSTDIQPDEWLNLRNVTPTKRGLRRESATENANSSGTNTIAGAVQAFQRLDQVRNYASLGNAAGYAMPSARSGFLASQFAWSSMGSTTGRNIVITIAADTLSATIAGTYITGGVTHNYQFDGTFMLEVGDRLFDPLNPSNTSLIASVTSGTLTFAASEHAVPSTCTTLNILYKWQSQGYPASLGYFVDVIQIGAVTDTGRTPATLDPVTIPAPALITTSLGRPIEVSVAIGGKTKLNNAEGFEGLLSLRDDGANGFSHYPVDSDTVVKAISARTGEMFRGFLYLANTRELAAVVAATVDWVDVAYGGGVFVAICGSGNVAGYSAAGTTWVKTTLPASRTWAKVCYSTYLGKFIAVASNSTVGAQSTDGITWTSFTLPAASAWTDVVSFEKLRIVVAFENSSTSAYHSADLITWTSFTMPGSAHKCSATLGSTAALVTMGSSATGDLLRYSTLPGSAGTILGYDNYAKAGIAYDSSAARFVSAALEVSTGILRIYYSSTGASWTLLSSMTPDTDITTCNLYVSYNATYNTITIHVASLDAKLRSYVSTDSGVTWTTKISASSIISATRMAISTTGVMVFATSSGTGSYATRSSADGGVNWTTTAQTYYLYDIIYDSTNNRFIAGTGNSGSITTSADGTTWNVPTAIDGASVLPVHSLAWNTKLGMLIMFRDDSSSSPGAKLYRSTDLAAFTGGSTYYSPKICVYNSMAELFEFVDGVGESRFSYDGATYSSSGPMSSSNISSVAFATNSAKGVCGFTYAARTILYINVVLSGTAITLAANRDWRDVAWSTDLSIFAAVAYGTDKGQSSTDGVTWTERTMPSNSNWVSVDSSTKTQKFVAVALGGTAAGSSTNGTSWTARTLPSSFNWRAVASGDADTIYIAVANSAATGAKSTDGTTWAAQTLFDTSLWAQYGTRIRWSLGSDPRNFTNVLNYLDLPEQNSQIIKLLSDGQRLMAYLSNTIYYAVATGDANLPFTFLKLETGGIGLAAQLGICRVKDAHIFVGRNNVYAISNLQIVAIGDPIVDVTIRKLQNTVITQCYYNEARNCVVFGFAVASPTYIDEIWILNLDTKSWSCLAKGLSLTTLSGYYALDTDGTWKMRNFTIDSSGVAELQSSELTVNADSTILETGDLSFENSDNVTEYFRLKLNIDENEFGATRVASITFAVAYSTDFGKTYKQIPGVLRIPVGQQEGYINFRAMSNYIRFRLTSTSSVAPYTITSYTIDMKLMAPSQNLRLSGGQL